MIALMVEDHIHASYEAELSPDYQYGSTKALSPFFTKDSEGFVQNKMTDRERCLAEMEAFFERSGERNRGEGTSLALTAQQMVNPFS